MSEQVICKVCGKTFKNDRALHCHIKEHNIYLAEYYTKYYPRLSKLNQTPISFKKGMSKAQYFSQDFIDKSEMNQWLEAANQDEVKKYIFNLIESRVKEKNLKFTPSHLELKINNLPSIDHYIKHFKSYSAVANKLNIEPMFSRRIPDDFFENKSDMKIFIDTREQLPLTFKNSEFMKLDFGDYTAAGEHYSYTYVDRKSANDFIGTLSLKNIDRFKRELERAKMANSYIFIVIDSSLEGVESYIRAAKRNKFGPSKINLSFIYHNMREISHEFKGVCQFVFSGSRESSEEIIPKILFFGERMWDVDLQYYLDKK
tara:strand:- start:28442 stop:29386 length:945 start_codon:yes stop_codon:yes gene_type:complete